MKIQILVLLAFLVFSKGNFYGQIVGSISTDYFSSGCDKMSLDDYHGAIQDFTKVIGYVGNDIDACTSYENRARCQICIGDTRGALLDFNQSIRIDPTSPTGYYGMAEAQCILGNFQEAIQNYNKAILLDSQFSPGYYSRGVVNFALGEFDSAIEDFNMAIELDPFYFEAYYLRAQVNLRKNNLSSACVDFKFALSHGVHEALIFVVQNCKE
jgi:tetratricopeptide (TPR) repeat protein